jgi:hypothetical protein
VERCDSEHIDDGESHQRDLDGGRVKIYRCRAEELSGVVVALIVGRSSRCVDLS